jgi:hypothetical protein
MRLPVEPRPRIPLPPRSLRLAPPRQWPAWLRIAVPVLMAGALVLFPFDWLADVWPAYARLFDVVFATALAHHIGHATIFFLAGLLALLAFPTLRPRPWLYLAVMAFGALGEEALQSLFKRQLPTLGDGRDLLFDLAGFAAAYTVVGVRRCFTRAENS